MLSSTLFHNLQKSIWSREQLKLIHRNTEQLARSVASYADYLSSQRKKMNTIHSFVSPVRQVSDSMSVKFVKASTGVLSCNTRLEMLSSCLRDKSEYEFVPLCDFLPDASRARYEYIQTLESNGLPYPIMLLTHSSGNNIGNLHFVWKLPAGKRSKQHLKRALELSKILSRFFHGIICVSCVVKCSPSLDEYHPQ